MPSVWDTRRQQARRHERGRVKTPEVPQSDPPWAWTGRPSNVCIRVFFRAVAEWRLVMDEGAHILDIGCSEDNWLQHAEQNVPGAVLYGVDCRKCKWPQGTLWEGDVRNLETLSEGTIGPETLDWVVLISALEHIGLGHYTDPVFEDGDYTTLDLAHRWLKPGGSIYFDIPWTNVPGGGYLKKTSYRVYDQERLDDLRRRQVWTEQATLCQPDTFKEPWVYKAHWWRKTDAA